MNAIEIRNLSKSFRGMYAVDHLNMTVPVGAIYGFIGENGSGKSTTEKLVCGHLVPNGGEIRLFGRDYRDAGVRVRVGALIENTGCFPNSSVWDNLMMQAINLGLGDRTGEINRVLKIVRMEDSARVKFKSCSLGMKQRIGIAMAFMILAYFIGAVLGGAIAGLSFDPGAAGAGGIVMCLLSKVLLMAVFVPIYLLMGVVGKQKLWLSMVGSFIIGLLFFMMIPALTPLDSGVSNVILCLAGGGLFSIGLGAVSNLVLKKTSLV